VKLGRELAAAVARRRQEAVRGNGPAALDRIFDALEVNGCDPQLTSDGRGIVARCPCCNADRALVVELPKTDEGAQ
jgi:hypothetical protein